MKYHFNKQNDFIFQHSGKLWNPAWSHVLTNGRLSCTVTDRFSGNVWYDNAREFRVIPWINDADAQSGGEKISINGNSVFAANDGIPAVITYGFGFAQWRKRGVVTTVYIDHARDCRVITVECSGEFTAEYSAEFVMGGDNHDAKLVVIENRGSGITVRSLNANEPEYNIYFDCKTELSSELGLSNRLCVKCSAFEKLTIVSGFGDIGTYSDLSEAQKHWGAYCGNEWTAYQIIACRLFARGSIYQSGGAYGFRDQLQDVCGILDLHPELAKEQILRCCAHQYEAGDVMHWWHSARAGNPEKGVRTHCSDDLMWLVYAVSEYVRVTGDRKILREEVPYITSAPLSDDESDRYESAIPTDYTESVQRHCERAIQLVLRRNPDSGLLNIGSGDWNDGFDRVGGKSVWLTWFFLHCVTKFADITRPMEREVYEKVNELSNAANDSFNGSYFERAYYADGTPLPILDSLAQSWAIISGFGDKGKCRIALRYALNTLWDRENKLVKLFDPPFDGKMRSPGYISAYLPGVRENGGQYTHAAIWLAIACLKTKGFEKDGRDILNALSPLNHDINVYRAEPLVIAADVYTNPKLYGRAGWTWYTGAAAWYRIARRIEQKECSRD